MQKKYIVLHMLMILSINSVVFASNIDTCDPVLTHEPQSTEQHEKAIDPLDELEDEFAEFDAMISEMNPEDFPEREPAPWAIRKLADISATLYMKYRSINKWISGDGV